MLASDNQLLETAFDVFNEVYFDGKLPKAVITIQSSPKCFGYITVYKVWKDGVDSFQEINIAAEHLSRPIENVLATLLHEMVHLYCMVNDIKDTSNLGRYHNKRFKAEAEKRDLKIGYAQYIGYSLTLPTDGFIAVIQAYDLYSQIAYCRTTENRTTPPTSPTGGDDVGGDDNSKGKRKTSTRKYICTHCGISVRATKEVNLICGDCMDTMVTVE